jgi:hypothetical protein
MSIYRLDDLGLSVVDVDAARERRQRQPRPPMVND